MYNKKQHHALAVLYKLKESNQLGFQNLLITEFLKEIMIFDQSLENVKGTVSVTPIKNLLYFALNYFKLFMDCGYEKNNLVEVREQLNMPEMIAQTSRISEQLLAAIEYNAKVNKR